MNANNYVAPCMSEKEEKFIEKEENGVRMKSTEHLSPATSFKGHLINSRILENIKNMHIEEPTLVQKYVVPLGLHGKDLLITAPTGMGKTISFLVPTINCLISSTLEGTNRFRNAHTHKTGGFGFGFSRKKTRALILTPTRELAMQVYEDSQKLLKGLSVTSGLAYGGVSRAEQESAIKKGVDIIIGTPGRVKDFAERKLLDLSKLSVLILDEADRMLEMGFEPQIRAIEIYLDKDTPRQTMMFSATFPDSLQKLAKEFFQKTPSEVHVGHGPLEAIKQEFVHIEGFDANRTKKNERFLALLEEYGYTPSNQPIDINAPKKSYSRPSVGNQFVWKKKNAAAPSAEIKPKEKEKPVEDTRPKIVVFVDQKVDCRDLERFLANKGIACATLHGDKVQAERESALYEFKNNISPILIATSVAARGLDIPGIALVINYAMPGDIKDYIHRIGRTGRAGKDGRAVTFISREDYSHAAALISILKKSNQKIPPFLEEISEVRVKGSSSGRPFGNIRHSVGFKKKEKEDAGTHFYNTKEIKHKEASVLNEKIDIVEDIDWDQEIS